MTRRQPSPNWGRQINGRPACGGPPSSPSSWRRGWMGGPWVSSCTACMACTWRSSPLLCSCALGSDNPRTPKRPALNLLAHRGGWQMRCPKVRVGGTLTRFFPPTAGGGGATPGRCRRARLILVIIAALHGPRLSTGLPRPPLRRRAAPPPPPRTFSAACQRPSIARPCRGVGPHLRDGRGLSQRPPCQYRACSAHAPLTLRMMLGGGSPLT